MRKYPWDKWRKRKRFKTIYRGYEYGVADHTMMQMIRNYAYREGIYAQVEVSDGFVRFKFTEE